ncbi:NAD(P)-binding domain-containing protein [Myxococcus sp. AB056]|uniref:NAD(P)-binding domain-containing protein n=1 Tax=Myxococcus sp. AB056 TaxID=2562792 RepID=UPI0034CD35D2
MNIGIIVAGNLGATLARHLKALGHDFSLANARGVEGVTAISSQRPWPLPT